MFVNVEGKTVNNEVAMIKSSNDALANAKLEKAANSITVPTRDDKKDTSTRMKYLVPPILPSQATYYFDNNLMLARSCNIFAEDIILTNEINIKVKDLEDEEDPNNKPDFEDIIKSVEASKAEIAYMCMDYELNGAGCCKITKFEDDNEFRLTQIPQEFLRIIKIVDDKLQATPIYLVEQDMGAGDKRLYKILGETYPEDFDTYDLKPLGMVWWEGRDNFYNFYKKPVWLQCRESMNAQIALRSLDTEKINKGYNMNNIVFFNKKPDFFAQTNPFDKPIDEDNEEEESVTPNPLAETLAIRTKMTKAQELANNLKAAGIGTAIFYEETTEPMTMQVANLSDNNWEYLLEKPKQADQEIISSFGIPRERYMINDIKESMNSNKTASFYEMYTKTLNGKQLMYENGIVRVINHCYSLDYEILADFEVPMFSELINAKIKTYGDLFLKGLLTLGQTVLLLIQYISDLNLEDIDLTNPIYEMRFVNGKPIDDYNLDPFEQVEYNNVVEALSLDGTYDSRV